MKTARANFNTASKYAAALQPFKASALTGYQSRRAYACASDYADPAERARFEKARRADLVTYVVASYAVVIVWCDVWGDWHAVTTNRSVTTTKHQNKMRRELVRPLGVVASTFWSLFDDADVMNNADAIALRESSSVLVS